MLYRTMDAKPSAWAARRLDGSSSMVGNAWRQISCFFFFRKDEIENKELMYQLVSMKSEVLV